jgi:hypothetical protein
MKAKREINPTPVADILLAIGIGKSRGLYRQFDV